MPIVYERFRDRLEEAMPRSQDTALDTSELGELLGVDNLKVAMACRVLQRFGAAKCRLSEDIRGYQRRSLWWRPE